MSQLAWQAGVELSFLRVRRALPATTAALASTWSSRRSRTWIRRPSRCSALISRWPTPASPVSETGPVPSRDRSTGGRTTRPGGNEGVNRRVHHRHWHAGVAFSDRGPGQSAPAAGSRAGSPEEAAVASDPSGSTTSPDRAAGRGERICADTTVTNPADPGHKRAEPRLPGLGDRVDKPQRGLQVTGFGEGDSRGFVSRSGE
jgi:hypothetical protein